MKKFTFAILSLLAGTVLTAAQSELQKEINTQISAGKKVIKLTRPEYRSAKTIELRKLDGVTIDGNDVFKVYETAKEAVERARKGEGPTIIECLTYRWQGHHVGDPGEYRDPQELADWKAKEPIGVLEKRGLLTDAEIQEIKDAVEAEIQAACKFAEESPYPDASEAYTDLFVD